MTNFLESLLKVAEEIVQAIPSRLELPYALFGHSTGALIAYEVDRALTLMGVSFSLAFIYFGKAIT